MTFTLTVTLLFGVLCLYIVKSYFVSKNGKGAPLPPGPKGKPLIGNLLDLPQQGEMESLHWLRHKDLYGPISSVTVMGQTLIILNKARLAFELLEKRSSKHSSRAQMEFAGKLVGWEHAIGAIGYNDTFRLHRKQVATILGSTAATAKWNSLQETAVGHMLLRVLKKPECWLDHVKTEAGAVILKIAYGYIVDPHKPDPLVLLAGETMEDFGQAAVPGVWMVDMMPFLKYLPDWFPLAGFKRTAKKWRANLMDLKERPAAFVKHQMAQGKHEPSYLSQLVGSGDWSDEQTSVKKWGAASLYAAGADTTVSSIATFFLAMTVYPEIQQKAQEEIDRVLGSGRLPSFSDRKQLPYIDAIVKEILRWHPVAPMGLPHETSEEDICEGYLIPKGAILLPNIWAYAHDPSVYHDPFTFKPERFLSREGYTAEPDPHKIAFGFGRRICPGRLLADASLFLNAAQILAVYKISKAIENGVEAEPVAQMLPGVVSHPAPFKTSIKPRSDAHEALISSLEETYPWPKSDAETLKNIKY